MTTLVDKYLAKGPSGGQPTSLAPKKEETEEDLVARMHGIMKQSPVVLFMKGAPDNPRCGFSKKSVALLREKKVAFTHFDILEDEAVRQGDATSSVDVSVHSSRAGLKTLNDWPTYPQFIVNGEFVGGLDVVTEMVSSGEFEDVFPVA